MPKDNGLAQNKNLNPKIGIIGGKGRMGKLFAAFFREKALEVFVSDLGTELSNIELAKKSDIIIVSLPIDFTEKVISEVLPFIKKDAAITDLTSVKFPAVNAMLKGKCEVFGMHPMFADTHPIPGQTIIMCETEKSGKYYKWMEELLLKNTVKIIKLSAEEHDETMSIAQGVLHFADIAFTDALRKMKMPVKEIFKYCSMASQVKIQLAARLVAQDAGLYANIQIANKKNLEALKKYQKSIEDLVKIVENKDVEGFKKYFNKNKEFLGEYAKEAFVDSTYLIAKFLEKQGKQEQNKIENKILAQKTDIALLGPKYTFTDLGASKFIKTNELKNKKYYTKTISKVIDLVQNGEVEMGLIPIENKIQGTVRETLDGLFYNKVHIIDSVKIPIHHNIIALSGVQKSEIKQIYSHPQALRQCKKYLKKNFPNAELLSITSTAAAAEKVSISSSKSIAAIASELAAEKPNLQIIDTNIEDQKGNETEFIIIKKGDYILKKNSPSITVQASLSSSLSISTSLKTSTTTPQIDPHPTTSLAFYFAKDTAGSLFEILKEFAAAKINMTKIESRPTQESFGEYIFFINCEASINDMKMQKLLEKIETKVAYLKVLGGY